jgi:hypothetical protein
VLEDNYSLIKNLTRGSLLYPKENVIDLVMLQYILFTKLIKNYEEQFFNVYNKRAFFVKLVQKYFAEEEYTLNMAGCTSHKDIDIAELIIKTTTNTLLKNFCANKNDQLEKKKAGRKLITFQK